MRASHQIMPDTADFVIHVWSIAAKWARTKGAYGFPSLLNFTEALRSTSSFPIWNAQRHRGCFITQIFKTFFLFVSFHELTAGWLFIPCKAVCQNSSAEARPQASWSTLEQCKAVLGITACLVLLRSGEMPQHMW